MSLPPALLAWAQLALCAAVIGYAGVKLTVYGNVIADKTGLGGTWVGVIMLATVTSLPEMVTGLVSVTAANQPDIAVGNVMGACVINLLVFVLIDLTHRSGSFYQRSNQGHIVSASFGVLMLGFVGFSILLSQDARLAGAGLPLLAYIGLGHVGVYAPLIVMVYAVAMRSVFRFERAQAAVYVDREPDPRPDQSLRQAIGRYAAAALTVVAAGIALPFIGDQIANTMGWRHSFVGTLFVALATTIPEIVVSVSAVRIGAVNMAVGNLLGSNLFNLFLLAVDDLFYAPGPLFAHASPSHSVSAFSALMMTGLALIGLIYRPDGRLFRTVGWISLVLFAVYLANSYVVFLFAN